MVLQEQDVSTVQQMLRKQKCILNMARNLLKRHNNMTKNEVTQENEVDVRVLRYMAHLI